MHKSSTMNSDRIVENVTAEQSSNHSVSNSEDLDASLENATLIRSLGPMAESEKTFWNFVCMAVLFSANHGCTVACLSLATSRFGQVGAWQSGTLYLTYTASAIMGATYIVKTLGARDSLISGMVLYCVYVACFLIATIDESIETPAALVGAAIGGVGGGFLWTAQGAYFGTSAELHAEQKGPEHHVDDSTSLFAGVFAFVYLSEEVLLRSLSTGLISYGIQWGSVFGVYTLVAVISTIGMCWIKKYPKDDSQAHSSILFKVTATLRLLRKDPKMKYMIGLNAAFGFSGAFLNSYVNGEVVRVALNDDESKYVGILSAMVAVVAALCSLIFGRISQQVGKGPILILGSIAFFFVAFPFLVAPDISTQWGWGRLIMVYMAQGVGKKYLIPPLALSTTYLLIIIVLFILDIHAGRATFESTLRATFGDYFSYEKEGAFGNIILQNGLASTIGFFLSFYLTCGKKSSYCVEYNDGTLHEVLTFELLVVVTSILAIVGYLRASILFQSEQPEPGGEAQLLENEIGVST